MRTRRVVPALVLTLVLAACGNTTASRARSSSRPTAAPHPASVADRAVLLSTAEGAVSVRTATGGVGFRAPNGIVAPDRSTVVQAEPLTSGTRVVASDAVT